MNKFQKADERKKKAIDRLRAAVDVQIITDDAAIVMEGIIHDLFSWSEGAEQMINTQPELAYLKDE